MFEIYSYCYCHSNLRKLVSDSNKIISLFADKCFCISTSTVEPSGSCRFTPHGDTVSFFNTGRLIVPPLFEVVGTTIGPFKCPVFLLIVKTNPGLNKEV